MKKLVGVASCPAGIAHTYIAAETLIKFGKKNGYEVKIETNGAGGVENRLTRQDIQEAEAIIVAADTRVELERFRGRPVLFVSSSDAIHRGANVIQMIMDGKAEIYNP
ncbi:MAG: PTS fructose transporter subunit IIB [Bacteroidetes bacterium]|nr:PTS fructose transporter subunit IIB [Bacteroidota bacterium]